MKRLPYGRLISVAIFLIALFVISTDDIAEYFRSYIGGSPLGALSFVVLLAIAVVIAPVTVLPVIPLASSVFGGLLTGILSILGWTIGAVVAFLLARHIGRPVLRYFVELEKIDALEKRFSATEEFMSLVFLRMIIPVEVLSYAAGFLTKMPLRTYALATAIGVAPFSFIFAYGGAALAEGSYLTLLGIVIFGALLFFLIARQYRKRWHSSTNSR